MTYMQKLIANYKDKNLILKILVGMFLGAILGILTQKFGGGFLNGFAGFAEILGNLSWLQPVGHRVFSHGFYLMYNVQLSAFL